MYSARQSAKRAIAIAALVSVGLGGSIAVAPNAFAATGKPTVSATKPVVMPPKEPTTTTTAPAGRTLEDIKKAAEAQIDRRYFAIAADTNLINASKHMTDAHKATLLALLTADKTGLVALRAKIAADTDKATAIADAKSIVHDYRIYLLVAPKVNVTDGADTVVYVASQELTLAAELAAQSAALKAQGKDTRQIDIDIAQAQGQANTAASVVAGQADAILALVAQDFPNNRAARDATRVAVRNGTDDVKQARDNLHAARDAIKALTTPTPASS